MGVSGHCLCRSVTYTAGAPLPLATTVCNCEDCQRSSGSFGTVVVPVRTATFKLTGATKTYRKDGSGGDNRDRVFCPECGSQLYSVLAENAEITWLKAGTLDDKSKVRPTLEVWTASALPFTSRLKQRPHFKHGPPRVSVTALRPLLRMLGR